MAKQVKKVYRGLAWVFSVVIAAGTLAGCGTKYGVPTTKYGAPPQNGYVTTMNSNNTEGNQNTNY